MIRLTDEQRERIRNHFPEEHFPDGRPGHKLIPTRRVLEAVLWILNTGAQRHMLSQSYPVQRLMAFYSIGSVSQVASQERIGKPQQVLTAGVGSFKR